MIHKIDFDIRGGKSKALKLYCYSSGVLPITITPNHIFIIDLSLFDSNFVLEFTKVPNILFFRNDLKRTIKTAISKNTRN